MKIDKKIIIIISAVLIIIVGLYCFNKWHEQNVLRQVVKDMYGIDIKDKDLEALNKFGQNNNEQPEVNKTPEEKYNETKEASLAGKISPAFTDELKPEVIKVFGKAKTMAYGKGYYGYEGSFMTSFKVPKVITSQDLAKLEEDYSKIGYETQMNEVSANAGSLTMSKNEADTIMFSYDGEGSQDLIVWYTPAQ